MTRKSILKYVKKMEKVNYAKCECGGKMLEDKEKCARCLYKKCELEDCKKYLLKSSKYNICFECHQAIKEYLD